MSDIIQIEPKPSFRGKNDLAVLRKKLNEANGPTYWKSLEQIAATEEFQDVLKHEFPSQADVWSDGLSRRKFLSVMGASLALGGLTNCTIQPRESIVPYARRPESDIPGVPRYFATMTSLGGYAQGVLAESHQGRPTHIEGNPEHPASLGAASAFSIASVLDLYDPDRSQVVRRDGRISGWISFLAELQKVLRAESLKQGAGLRLLTRTVGSPLTQALIERVLEKYPKAKWHQWEAVNRDNSFAGAEAAFGERLGIRYELDAADVIVSLDADFLSVGPAALRYAREFSRRRRVSDGHQHMNRLYVAEPEVTTSGSAADHRLRLKASDIPSLCAALAARLGVSSGGEHSPHAGWIDAVAQDLRDHPGRSLVIVGDQQPAFVHAAAHAINERLGNIGKTVHLLDNPIATPIDQTESISELAGDMSAGHVDALLILGGNPVYDAPADLEFAQALQHVPFQAHLGLHSDETSAQCQWHLPMAHALESWGDGRAFDGTHTLQQPLIEPLYEGISDNEVLLALLGKREQSNEQALREHLAKQWQVEGEAFEKRFRTALHAGLVEGSAFPSRSISVQADWSVRAPMPPVIDGIELLFRPDDTVWDGRWANNGWLQEAPKPLTKLTWDNAALLSPATAEHLHLTNGDVVTLRLDGRSVEAPVWISPGQADDCCSIALGYGREKTGHVGSALGFNAYRLRATKALHLSADLEVEPSDRTYRLASVQDHGSMEERHLVRHATLDGFSEDPAFPKKFDHSQEGLSIFPAHEYEGNAWGMTIDLNACIGCNGCMLACQSENNIPVVGKEQVLMGREMAWIRIDRYFEGPLDEPQVHHQPVGCMHCENAPCEIVCPVGATVHSSEGLNEMVYNRCVGTRYCSNNCPYKVRRFNFLLYSDFETESYKMMRNPDVTVRSRGVMEKCTYCVQRINGARITAEKDGREIRDGEIQTACEAACPTEAITFGNINDPRSRVAKLKADPRNYGLLTELNTAPRTTYLAKVTNPNPRLAAKQPMHGEAAHHGD